MALFNATAADISYTSFNKATQETLLHNLPPFSLASDAALLAPYPYKNTLLRHHGDAFVLENELISVTLDTFGRITSMSKPFM